MVAISDLILECLRGVILHMPSAYSSQITSLTPLVVRISAAGGIIRTGWEKGPSEFNRYMVEWAFLQIHRYEEKKGLALHEVVYSSVEIEKSLLTQHKLRLAAFSSLGLFFVGRRESDDKAADIFPVLILLSVFYCRVSL